MNINEHVQPMDGTSTGGPTTDVLARCRKICLKSSTTRRIHHTRLVRLHTSLNIDHTHGMPTYKLSLATRLHC